MLQNERCEVAIETAWCCILQASVARLTTLEGEVVKVLCPEFEWATKTCRQKEASRRGGPLSQLLEQVSDQSLSDRGTHCNLA